ncbi:TonB-dependent receptor [Ferruginibacter sp.]|uniref:TonB-dependent receptor n=1 Tax=Ferruginibacter sp. TaxID=1940288 RepID=UPI001982EDA1|nr:TonB-dependent receptor [Ferruginibacter sp.]MBC7628060.1 TonB-dependent receptor [Ferruginibacter sp.]
MKLIISTVVLLCATQYLCAQNSLSGKVTDKDTKKPLTFITVSIPDLHTSVLTDSTGHFTFNRIPSASYEIQISAVGYKIFSKVIQINGSVSVNFELDKSSMELTEVVVTGSSKATQIKKSPLPIIAVNKAYLTTNLSTNVIDAIAKIPGVSAVTTGPNVSKPYIRGLGFNRILTLYDGMRQEGQQWGDEHGIEMDNYGVDRIEVVKGPASLMYGSDALAGVINLIPSQPAPNGKIAGAVTTEYQTNNGMYGGSAFLTGNKNGFEWGGRISKRMAKDFKNSIDGRVYNTAFNETAGSAFAGLHKKWGFSHLSLSIYDNLQEIPDGSRDSLTRQFTKQITEEDLLRPIVTNSELNSYNMSVLHQRVQHYRAFSKNSFFFGDSRLDANFGFQRSVRREFSHPEVPYQNVAGLDLQLNTFNYDVKYFLPEFNKWAVAVGVNGMFQSNNVTSGTEFVIPSYNQFDFGGFATIKKDFGNLNVSGGLRYDYRKITNDELYTKSNATSGFDQPVTGVDTVGANKLFSNYSTNFKGVTGSIGLSYSVDKNWAVKFNFARGYRAPNISEISANGVHPGTGFYQIGNAQFKPEFSNQVDIGASYTSSTINAGASLFINQIDNYIYNERLLSAAGGDSLSASGVQVYPTYKFKSGKVLLYGVEGNIDFHIIKPLHFDNSVSLIYGDNKSFIGAEKRDDNKYVPLIPPFRYISELRYDLAQNSKCLNEPFIKLQVQYTAAQNRVFSYDNTETATQGYTLINIGAGTGFKNKAGKTVLNVYVLANNVFDVAFQNHLSRLKYFEQYSASPNGHLGIYNVGRNISLKLVKDF